MKLSQYFLPHSETHKKAHLISVRAFSIYILFFIVLQVFFNFVSQVKPGVLGVAAEISQKDLISLTNAEREKNGLPKVRENTELDKAAMEKAKNMFEEDYWSHYSPSGKDPWGFINGAGYKFSFAGENLARNFSTSSDVVQAWMDSPTHRENILNSHYQEIGIAVVKGTLLGQETTLVVQEFGRPLEGAVASMPDEKPLQTDFPEQVGVPATPEVAGEQLANKPSFVMDPLYLTKVLGLSVLGMIFLLTLIDVFVIRRRAVARMTSRHLPHLGMMAVAAITLINMKGGSIL